MEATLQKLTPGTKDLGAEEDRKAFFYEVIN